MTTERWLPIAWTDGDFEVSDLGRVRRIRSVRGQATGKLRKPWEHIRGRLYIDFYKRGNPKHRRRLVYQLVAEAFIGPYPPGMEINHIDGNTRNNCAENLEYVTHRQNIMHAYRTGLAKALVGEGVAGAKLTDEAVRYIRRSDDPLSALALRFGVSKSAVYRVRCGHGWIHVI